MNLPTANASVPTSIPAYTVADDGELTYAKVKYVSEAGEITYFADSRDAVDHCANGGEVFYLLGRNHGADALWVLFCWY